MRWPESLVKSEKEILEEVINILKPKCIWLSRINGGRFMLKGRGANKMFVSYRLYRDGIDGEDISIRLPDLIGQLKDGRFLAIEVKKPGGTVTDEQARFLQFVWDNGGVSGICYDAEDAIEIE